MPAAERGEGMTHENADMSVDFGELENCQFHVTDGGKCLNNLSMLTREAKNNKYRLCAFMEA